MMQLTASFYVAPSKPDYLVNLKFGLPKFDFQNRSNLTK